MVLSEAVIHILKKASDAEGRSCAELEKGEEMVIIRDISECCGGGCLQT